MRAHTCLLILRNHTSRMHNIATISHLQRAPRGANVKVQLVNIAALIRGVLNIEFATPTPLVRLAEDYFGIQIGGNLDLLHATPFRQNLDEALGKRFVGRRAAALPDLKVVENDGLHTHPHVYTQAQTYPLTLQCMCIAYKSSAQGATCCSATHKLIDMSHQLITQSLSQHSLSKP
jgi:hypothetical protein